MFKNLLKYENSGIRLLYSVAIAGLLMILYSGGFFQPLEEVTLDYRYQQYSRPDLADSNVVIVAIDNGSLDFFDEQGFSWPWSRDIYAFLAETLEAQGAAAVLFDLLLYSADLDRFEFDSAVTDQTLARTLETNERMIIGAELVPATINNDDIRPNISIGGINTRNLYVFEGIMLPYRLFYDHAQHVGATNVVPGRGGIVRHTYAGFNVANQFVPSLAVRTLFAGNAEINTGRSQLRVNGHTYPLDRDTMKRIYWYGPPGPDGVFRYVSFASVITGAADPDVDLSFFKDKYVVVGAYASGLLDYKPTPIAESGAYPGMEIWATVLSNYLNNHFVSDFPPLAHAILLFILSALVMLVFRFSSPTVGFTCTVLLALGYTAVSFAVWYYHQIPLPMSTGFLSVFLSFGLISLIAYVAEGKSKRILREIFGRYIHPDVIQQLVESPEEVKMGGDMIHASIMFTDIANFTNYSEGKRADQLVTELNEYLSVITEMILDEGGLLDKFTGDGLMALFGVPISTGEHANIACRAALRHSLYTQKRMRETPDDPKNFFHVNTRIGINSGEIIAGNIGSFRRMDYTAIGDDVNLAARLEGVNKVYGTRVIIGEQTKAILSDEFFCRELDAITVKGKEQPLRIFELVGFTSDITESVREKTGIYEQALHLYREAAFAQASELFGKLADEDPASAVMQERCSKLIIDPPVKWEGVYKMETK